jgi:hypothetical protein
MIIDDLQSDETVPAEYAMSPIEYKQFVQEYNHWLDTVVYDEECDRINRLIDLTLLESETNV